MVRARAVSLEPSIQLILDNGAQEYILRPTAEDARIQVELFKQGNTVYFDLDRSLSLRKPAFRLVSVSATQHQS